MESLVNSQWRPYVFCLFYKSGAVEVKIHDTVGSQLFEHVETKGCSDNWNVHTIL